MKDMRVVRVKCECQKNVYVRSDSGTYYTYTFIFLCLVWPLTAILCFYQIKVKCFLFINVMNRKLFPFSVFIINMWDKPMKTKRVINKFNTQFDELLELLRFYLGKVLYQKLSKTFSILYNENVYLNISYSFRGWEDSLITYLLKRFILLLKVINKK